MKHLFVFFLFALFLCSCDKDKPSPQPEENVPTITSFLPVAGTVGTTVIISGNYFDGANKLNNQVKFNGVNAVVEEASNTQLRVTVPTGAISGKITVEVAGKAALSANAFIVTTPDTDPDDPAGWIVTTHSLSSALTFPRGITKDKDGNLYITDMHVIKKIVPDGTISVYAGTGVKGSTDGNALTQASFDQPTGLAFDSEGNLFVADHINNCIRKVSVDGQVTTFAGKADQLGMADGTGEEARFALPYGIAVDAADNIYVSDLGNRRIRKITRDRVVTTFAGNGSSNSSDAPIGVEAGIPQPGGITIDKDGMLYITERGGGRIRKIDPSGTVSVSSIGGYLSVNTLPSGIVVDNDKNVYVTYTGLNKIRKITPTGVEEDFAGSESGDVNGAANNARFFNPEGLVLIENPTGRPTFFIVDRQNKKIKKLAFAE